MVIYIMVLMVINITVWIVSCIMMLMDSDHGVDEDYYLGLYHVVNGKKYHSLDIFCIMLKMEICIMVARSVAQSIEAGAANQAWMAQNYDDIRGWLREQNKAARAA